MNAEAPILLTDIVNHHDSVSLADRYERIRSLSLSLVEPLSYEDCQIQSMPDASPIKWHLAHTTWFFEVFILKKYCKDYLSYAPRYDLLFNSHYHGVGPQYDRNLRGVLSRPTVNEILRYREYVDEQMVALLNASPYEVIEQLVLLGLSHEQRHQEAMLMDIKHAFFQNPLYPVYAMSSSASDARQVDMSWTTFEGGLLDIGSIEANALDDEKPRHPYYLRPYRLASRLSTNGEYLRFIQEGGYQLSEYWLSDGWQWLQESGTFAPLYWVKEGDQWFEFTLGGLQPLKLSQPVCHVSYYEAAAFAAWQGKRLPSEQEWEAAVKYRKGPANYFNPSSLQPRTCTSTEFAQVLGDVWEWTTSAYAAYPGFKPFGGDMSEYSAKFMSGKQVMRGGSCLTPPGFVRPTSRSARYHHQRWQMGGIRLAQDAVD